METSLVKYSLITIAKVLVILLAILFVLTKCGGCGDKIESIKTDNSHLLAKIKIDSLKLVVLETKLHNSEFKNDSLTVVKEKVKLVYLKSSKDVRNEIKQGICDTVKVLIALNDCDSLIKSDSTLLAIKDTTIKILKQTLDVQKDVIDINNEIIVNKDKDYTELEKSSKKALRKQKFKTVVTIVGTVIIEALTIFALK